MDDIGESIEQTAAVEAIIESNSLAVGGGDRHKFGDNFQTDLSLELNQLCSESQGCISIQKLQAIVKKLESEKVQILEARNQELESQLEKRTAEITNKLEREYLVASISARIRYTFSLNDVLDITVNGIRLLLKCDRVVVYQFQPSRDGVIVAESVAAKSLSVINEKVVDTCFQNEIAKDYLCGKIRAINDVYKAGLTSCHLQLLEQFSIKANLIVPILIQGKEEFVSQYFNGIICNENVPNECLWGLLIAHQCDAPRHWQSGDLEILDQLSGQITIAIQQSLIYAQSQAELLERQNAEVALRESEERFRQLAENIQQVFYLTDIHKTAILYVSQSYENIWQRSCQELYDNPESYIESVHPDDLEIVTNAYAHQQLGENTTSEYRIIRPDGEIRWILARSFPINDRNGEVYRVSGIADDITDRKKAELELLELKEQLSLALKGSNDGWWDNNFVTGKAYKSERWWSMLGYANNELQPSFQIWQSLLHPDEHDHVVATFHKALETKNQSRLEFENRLLHKLGHYVSILTKVYIDRDASGNPVRISGTNTDLTRWKQKEEELQQTFEIIHELNHDLEAKVVERTQELQRQIAAIEASIDGIAIVNEQGEYTHLNAAYLQMFGYQNANELLGKSWKMFYSPEEIQRIEQEISLAISVHKKWTGEALARRCDGSQFIEELSVTMVNDVGLIRVSRDITDRKKLEENIRQSLVREKEINQLRSDLIATASHEFRTPLTVIASSAEVIDHYSDRLSTDKKKLHLQRIQSSVNHMVNLLDDVLMLNQQEQNKLEFHPQTIDLVAFCENIIEDLQLNIKEHQIVFTPLQTGIIQQVLTMLNIQGDPKLIRQILTNLLTNAIKYSPKGGNIYLNLRAEASNIVLQIQDHGIGIPLADQSQIFDSFYRAKNVDTISGTGLGLTIVKRCVELHRGTINLDTQEGKGTVFTITLPYSLNLNWCI